MILILGKGVSSEGVMKMCEALKFKYACLLPYEVSDLYYDLIVKSPGIKANEEVLIKARKEKIEIITDIEFAYRYFKRNYIAITGTNGKTTTSLLVGKLIDEVVCGNVGYSIGSALLDNKNRYNYICELSSFQLSEIKKFTPYIACFLNISQAHLDYHKDMDDYVNAKMKLVNNMNDGTIIYNLDDDILQEQLKNHVANKMTFSLNNKLATCYIKKKKIFYQHKKIIKIKKILLKGDHNLYNVLASICIAKIFDVKNKKIKEVLKEFKGIEYRGQLIAKKIYNDAKSTNPASTLAMIRMHSKCNLICGGYSRNEDFSILDLDINRVKKVYCYGEGKSLIKQYMEKHNIVVESFDCLEMAYKKAKRDKIKIPLIYSPMMASWDQYNNYTQRGSEFDRLVQKK